MIWLQYTIQSMLASLGMTLAIIIAALPFVYSISMLALVVSVALFMVSYLIFPHLAFEQLRAKVNDRSGFAETFFVALDSLRWFAAIMLWGYSIYLGVRCGQSWPPHSTTLPLMCWFLAYCLYPASYRQRSDQESWLDLWMLPQEIIDLAFTVLSLPITMPLRAITVLRNWLD